VSWVPFIPILVILGVVLALVIGAIILLVALLRAQKRAAREAGYATLGAYLRAAPRTDADKRNAADLALKGVVICLLGLLFPPLLLIGLFPFFYGARKVIYASMGLGFVDDADQTA
jgi:hypothetical protein